MIYLQSIALWAVESSTLVTLVMCCLGRALRSSAPLLLLFPQVWMQAQNCDQWRHMKLRAAKKNTKTYWKCDLSLFSSSFDALCQLKISLWWSVGLALKTRMINDGWVVFLIMLAKRWQYSAPPSFASSPQRTSNRWMDEVDPKELESSSEPITSHRARSPRGKRR